MKKILAGALALALLNPTQVFAQAAAKPSKIVVAAYGGIWAESIKKNFVPCFEKKTGVKVDVITGESADWLARVRANPQKPPIDVLALAEADSLRAAREGLLDQITVEKVPNFANVPDLFHKAWDDRAVAQNFGGWGVMYNKEAIKNPPKTWRELLDGAAEGKFGKRISLPAGTYTWGPEFLWLASQQYDGSMDAVFGKMKAASEKSVVKFWSTPVEALNLFGTKEVDLVVYWDGRANAFIDKGNDWAGFYYPGPSTGTGLAMLSKPKNSPDIAWEYINCALDPENQAKHAETILYATSNQKTVYPEAVKAKVVPLNMVAVPPYDKVFDSFGSWIERWNKEIR